MDPQPYAECALSAYRNLIRDECATREDFARLQIEPGDPSDLRFPDWLRIFRGLAEDDETVVRPFASTDLGVLSVKRDSVST